MTSSTLLTYGAHLLRLLLSTLPLNLNGVFASLLWMPRLPICCSKESSLLLERRCSMQTCHLYFHCFPSGWLHFSKRIFSSGILLSTFHILFASFFKDFAVLSILSSIATASHVGSYRWHATEACRPRGTQLPMPTSNEAMLSCRCLK